MSKQGRRESAAARAAEIRAKQEAAERRRRSLVIAGIVAAIVLIIGGGFLIQNLRDTSDKAATPPAGVTDTYGILVGDASAPKTVQIYADFQCPVCQLFEQGAGEQLSKAVADKKIKIDYRMVAFLDGQSSTDYSSRALNAAAVVLDQSGVDAFVKFHDLLYANQPKEGSSGLSDKQLIEYAVEAGADEAAVTPGIKDRSFKQWAINATDQASKNGVTGTPTVFIDGKKIEGKTIDDIVTQTLAGIS